ncbi:MAG: aminotransferase class I/II-fold pyridoxal phosphate-dependent enzyme [Calditrichaeota bacterium]|nr:aminotransferase class I/II-fold pyridoxal phosphate-dependent enzyme [Calditrichota bacterium]
MARIETMLDRRRLTNRGPYVEELEQRLAAFLGVKHCITMCNGTVALEIAIRALGLTGEVIVPSMTFIATPHALQWQEITPVFCDIDPQTMTIDPAQVRRMITPKTSGILGVHLWGRVCNTEALQEIAGEHQLALLFDAAHAFGCSRNGRMVGNFGDAEVFSFHATKFFNTFEGGAVATNNDELAARMRLMQNFGFSGLDNVIYIGTNGKMNEVSAAMGLTGLESLDEFMAVNYQHYLQYERELADIPGIALFRFEPGEQYNYQYIAVEVDANRCGLSRDAFVEILHAENVRARRYFYPGCHRMEPYRSYFPNAGMLLPATERAVERFMLLPTGTAMDSQSISRLCGLIRFIAENGSRIHVNLLHRTQEAQLEAVSIAAKPKKKITRTPRVS